MRRWSNCIYETFGLKLIINGAIRLLFSLIICALNVPRDARQYML